MNFITDTNFLYGNLSYWAWIGTIMLIRLTYEDYKYNRNIDDRKNYLMMGVTISLISHLPASFFFMITLIMVISLLNVFLKKFKILGGADISTLSWIFYGLGIISIYNLMWFVIFFTIVTALYTLFKLKVFKYKKPTPFYPVILISFTVNCLIFGFY